MIPRYYSMRYRSLRLLPLLAAVLLLAAHGIPTLAWRGMKMLPLHIEGRYLCDDRGKHVNLHGFGQTYSPWFNEQGKGWGWGYNVEACLEYNKGLIDEIDRRGWKMQWLRLHADPYWSNDPELTRLWHEEHPGENFGEHVIAAFCEQRFRRYLDSLFIPMAQYAIEAGLYVVMRPPGVCPHVISPGDEYQQYLEKVWTIICSDPRLKNNPYVMFELANEPVRMKDGEETCPIFFQKIVDTIRSLGCNNILWVPGLGWQSSYQCYAKSPIRGENIGYAVHCYPGWYGSDSEAEGGSVEQGMVTKGARYEQFAEGWNRQVMPVAEFSPILLTEMDWAPARYNCSWGKATTGVAGAEGFGANFRRIMDETGNVSWMLFTGPEHLARYDDSLPDGDTFLTDPEACPRPIYGWFRHYARKSPIR